MKISATETGPFDQCSVASVLQLSFKLTVDLEQDASVHTTEYQSLDRNLSSAHSEHQRLIIRIQTDTKICRGQMALNLSMIKRTCPCVCDGQLCVLLPGTVCHKRGK